MSDSSTNLALPFIQPSQAQKHVTHNEAIARLDVLTQLAVVAFDAATPPAAPVEGAAYALGTAPTGAWAGQGGTVAAFQNGGWVFITPRAGWIAVAADTGRLRVMTPTGWRTPIFD
ncbi:Protein of unknown function [Palleronia marisminoris]|uniref:DUF2793 domain-containing protein n=1 Tax=Palleronia marisminoris TaxID=315423 RepID=A0A1Y5T390_9RHOB|nr:DUF2793 domain-containing protein [Palleronia marisminoris]SFH12849.1 Protein of unknown function [Palleronia marisminoris]SLN53181.1 hypothetical protein PAM7066_02490 [Palleronia marisminoris]